MASCAKIFKYIKQSASEVDYTKVNPKKWDWKQVVWPFRVMVHPFTGYEEMKYYKQGSVALGLFIMALWCFSGVFSFLETGFLFNINRAKDLSLFTQFVSTALLVILWTISNWAICTLLDGEGRVREIFISTAYAAMPQIVSIIPMAIISKGLIQEEQAFLTIARVVFFAWMLILLFVANTTMHQYSFGKSLVSMILTIFGIIIIMLLVVLVFSLFIQIWSFIRTIINEMFYRV